jgi:hypothetical protein
MILRSLDKSMKPSIGTIKKRKAPRVKAAATELGITYLPILIFFKNLIMGDPIKEMTQAMIT